MPHKSVHDGNHNSVVRIFVSLSCELWGFFILHGMEQFFPYQECNHHYPPHSWPPYDNQSNHRTAWIM